MGGVKKLGIHPFADPGFERLEKWSTVRLGHLREVRAKKEEMCAAIGLVVWAPYAVWVFDQESADALALVGLGVEVDDDDVVLRGEADVVAFGAIEEPLGVAIVRIIVPPRPRPKVSCPGPASSTTFRLQDRRGA